MLTNTQVLTLSLVRYVDQYTGTHSLMSYMPTNTQVLALSLVRYVDQYTGTHFKIGHICLPVHRYSHSHWSYMPTNTQVPIHRYSLSHWSDMSTNTLVLALSLVKYVNLCTGTHFPIGHICLPVQRYSLSHWQIGLPDAHTKELDLSLVRYVYVSQLWKVKFETDQAQNEQCLPPPPSSNIVANHLRRPISFWRLINIRRIILDVKLQDAASFYFYFLHFYLRWSHF